MQVIQTTKICGVGCSIQDVPKEYKKSSENMSVRVRTGFFTIYGVGETMWTHKCPIFLLGVWDDKLYVNPSGVPSSHF